MHSYGNWLEPIMLTVVRWISKRIVEILGIEDEVVIDYTFGLLEERHVSFTLFFG